MSFVDHIYRTAMEFLKVDVENVIQFLGNLNGAFDGSYRESRNMCANEFLTA